MNSPSLEMEDLDKPENQLTDGANHTSSAVGSAIAWGWVFLAVALILTAVGFYVMFTYRGYGDGPGRIVGGDAYNYIIIANRGIGFISAGMVSALLGIGCMLTGVLSLLEKR